MMYLETKQTNTRETNRKVIYIATSIQMNANNYMINNCLMGCAEHSNVFLAFSDETICNEDVCV